MSDPVPSDLEARARALLAGSAPAREPPLGCPHCGAKDVARAGTRKLKAGVRQLYRCGACFRRFSNLNRHGKRTPPRAVLDALAMVCQSYPYRDIVHALRRRHRVEVTPSAISKWVKEYQPPYLAIEAMNRRYTPVIRGHLFTHHGLPYHYQVHLPKLNACPLDGLKTYLLRLPEFIDHAMFDGKPQGRANPPGDPLITTSGSEGTTRPTEEMQKRCSQLVLARNEGLRVRSDSPISSLAARALAFAPGNRDRHPVLEQFFIACDRNTLAVEVLVYFMHGQLGSITGHVDILQFNFNKVWILDYKPEAAKEKPEKVITQLSLYAMALHYRAKISMQIIRCMYFDEASSYEFEPDPAMLDTSATQLGNSLGSNDNTGHFNI